MVIPQTFKDAMFQELTSILEEEGIDHGRLRFDTPLRELALSSMQYLRVVGALEDLVGMPLDAALTRMDTVDDLIVELWKLKDAM